ncbi:MAG: glycosyltransferase [Fuerstiella sp.]
MKSNLPTSNLFLSDAKRHKVLHVVNGEHYAGAARVQDLLAQHLPANGFDVQFATLLSGRFAEQRVCQDVPLECVPMQHRLDLRAAKSIAAIVQRDGISLLHSHTTRSAMIAAAASYLSHVPFVHHVHCQMNTEVGSRWKSQLNLWIERTACRRAVQTIAVSDSIRQFMKGAGFRTDHCEVVPNGVPAPAETKSERLMSDSWTIGMVALLRERKGLETLLKSLPLLKAAQNVRLKIVGPFETPEYERQIHDLANQLGISDQVQWTGFSSNVSGELLDMDVLVLPSVLAEGMPMVLLEAMASGIPIVGSNVDGITDVIQHQQNGLLSTPGCPNSLAEQLNLVLSGVVDWRLLRKNCQRKYHSRFSSKVMAEGVANVYRRVLPAQSVFDETQLPLNADRQHVLETA